MKDTEDLVSLLGKHLHQIRSDQKLTLEQLSEKSGVSRSMLSQIERGKTNPTFGTLWNLSKALGLDMSELVEDIEAEGAGAHIIEHLTQEETPKIASAQSGCTLRILGPPDLVGQCEWYELSIEVGGSLKSQPHAQGCREHLTLFEGEVEVISGSHAITMLIGDTARYPADIPHEIINRGETAVRALLLVLG
ncbi:MAG: XRE family transcriptional regulator [Chloroflexota bacterium]